MPHHNTFTAKPGNIVIYGEWTGSEYVEHQAYIRAIVGNPGGEDEPTINLTYSDGQGGADPVNNVLNIEHLTGDVDYWRAQFDPYLAASLPYSNTRPAQGEVVWLAVWDTEEEAHGFELAFVRAIPGPPSDQEPRLNLSYYDPAVPGNVNKNNVASEADLSDVTGEDFWFDLIAEG